VQTDHALDLFLDACRAKRLSPHTIGSYRRTVHRLAQISPELPLSPEPLRHLLAEAPGTDETAHGHFRNLRTFYNFLCLDKHVDPAHNPMPLVQAPRRRKKKRRFLGQNEVHRLLAQHLAPRDRALLRLLLDTGIRAGEAAALQTRDVSVETIVVDGKTGAREIPISADVRRAILASAGPQWVFTTRRGRRFTPRGICRLVTRAMQTAGIPGPKLGPHTLRHTFAHHWLHEGGDVFALQQILGHANLATTKIYVDLDTSDLVHEHRQHATLASSPALQLELTAAK